MNNLPFLGEILPPPVSCKANSTLLDTNKIVTLTANFPIAPICIIVESICKNLVLEQKVR